MSDMLKLGIIGCSGQIYDFMYDATKRYPLKLVAVCDSDKNTTKFLDRYSCPSVYTDYKKMLENEKLDLVISFPEYNNQYEVARDCLLAGANVYSERPVCLDSKKANELVELQSKTNRYIMSRLNRRFTPTFVMAKEIIDRPEFGKPKMYYAKFHATSYDSEESFVWNHVIHHLDLAMYMLGDFVITHADRVYIGPKKFGYNISFQTRDGCIGVIQTSTFQSGGFPRERIEVTGDDRNVILYNLKSLQYNRPGSSRQTLDSIELKDDSDTLILNQNFAQLNNFTYYGFEQSFEHFANCILSGKKPDSNMEDTLKTIEQVESLYNIIKKEQK
jgi:predicted dehydrogenase